MATSRPKLIVFDLDYTLWPFWVDTHVNPPFEKSSSGCIIDSSGVVVECYKEVPKVLKNLKENGYILGIASRTLAICAASQLINVFGWGQYFTYKEIYPGKKTIHFTNLRKQSGIEYKDMLFFDDQTRNIDDLREEGVTSILVEDGVTEKVVEDGLKEYLQTYL